MKAFAILWVIFGHEYFFHLAIASNAPNFPKVLELPFFLFVEGGMLAVDTFFFVGGFMVAYVLLKDGRFGISKVPVAIFNRMLRFWPSFLLVILLFYGVFLHLGSGPFWPANEPLVQICSHFWRSLLYIDNLVDNGR